MSIKNFDYKQFLLARGERVALIAAGVLAGVLALGLFVPPLFSYMKAGPTANKEALDGPTKEISRLINDPNNKPGPTDKPPEAPNKKLVAFEFRPVDGLAYQLEPLGLPGSDVVVGRRVPRVFAPDEVVAAQVRVHLRTYVMDMNADPPTIWCLIDKGDSEKKTGPNSLDKRLASFKGRGMGMFGGMQMGMRGMQGGMQMGMRGMQMGMQGGMQMGMRGMQMGMQGGMQMGMRMGMSGMPKSLVRPGKAGGEGENRAKDKDARSKPLTRLTENDHPAKQAYPLRLAVIAASFPFKKQLEEFKVKLNKRTVNEVLAEEAEKGSGKDAGKAAKQAPSLRFLGVDVARVELDGEGKEVGQWVLLDLSGSYRPYIVLSGRSFEPDDPKFAPVTYPGLVMPRLMEFRANEFVQKGKGMPGKEAAPAEDEEPHKTKYPDVEDRLVKVQETLVKLQGKTDRVIAPPKAFQGDNFNPFDPGAQPMEDKEVEKKEGTEATELPEHCLVRVVDVTVEPGKTYKYKLKIRMANPNLHRADVADPRYADIPYLESDWTKTAIVVHIEPEMHFYAVDQVDLDETQGKGLTSGNRKALKAGQAALQVHRWLESVPKGKDWLLVGEWAVAERMPVRRGEYLGRRVRVPVPVWRYTAEQFVIADDFKFPKQGPGIEVSFGLNAGAPQPEPIVVDLDTNRDHAYQRATDKSKGRGVVDAGGAEVLMLAPNGQLLLREGAQDAEDAERKAHLKEARARVRKIKDKDKEKKKDGPF